MGLRVLKPKLTAFLMVEKEAPWPTTFSGLVVRSMAVLEQQVLAMNGQQTASDPKKGSWLKRRCFVDHSESKFMMKNSDGSALTQLLRNILLAPQKIMNHFPVLRTLQRSRA